MVRTRTGVDQTRSGGGDGRYRSAKRVRQNHPINRNRGRLIDLDEGIKALVTVHPSYLLRMPDEDARAREYQRFVSDLKIAAELLRKSARAA